MSLDIYHADNYLSISVGGYLYGTRRGVGFCRVCTTPVDASYVFCMACRDNNHVAISNSTLLADLVLPLAYIDDEPQSKLLMHGYKGDQVGSQPQTELFISVTLMATLGLLIHRPCIEEAVKPLTALSFVPSTHGRRNPPIQKIANYMSEESGLPVIEATYIGPQPSTRGYHPSYYEISPTDVDRRHVLLIDDTWTSGVHAQSVASSLKSAGTDRVTILVVGRWLRSTWQASATFISSQMKQNPYNPFDCPVSGTGPCSPTVP